MTVEAIGKLLKGVPFFESIPEELLEELAEAGKVKHWEPGVTVFAEGDAPDYMYLILSGSVEVQKKADDGQEVRLVTLRKGAFFGEMALVDGSSRSAAARTLEACEFYTITRDKFTEMLSQCPQVIPAVLVSMVHKIRVSNEQFLLELCEKQKLREEVARERYRSIGGIAAMANDAGSIEEALQIVVDQISTYGRWSVGHAFIADVNHKGNQKGSLYSSSIWHMESPQLFEPFRRVSEMTRFSEGMGLPGRILARKKPIWVEDVSENTSCPRTRFAEETGLRSGFGFPVQVGKEITAVLEFYSDTPRPVDRLLLESTQQIGVQLGRQMERKRFEQELFHNAFHDPLTNLPNRSLFLDRLGLCVARANRNENYQYAVLFVDLDRFKVVNDSLGHAAGDQLLVEIARRIRNCVRATDTVARLGGDEFGILLEDFAQWSDVPRAVERIQTELQSPIALKDREVYTTASIGIALSSTHYKEVETPLRDADTAMYRAKAEGPGQYVVFDPSMHKNAVKRLQLENDLWRAVERRELRLHYQPIVKLKTGEINGVEALVRWQHPEHGLVSPGEFLPVAEETDLILPITEWVFEEACRQVREWLNQKVVGKAFSVNTNLSVKYLTKLELVERLQALLEKYSLEASNMKLEITESQILKDPVTVGRILAQLNEAGIRVQIDDFGTGYSSLAYLASLPVRGLKVDQSFVQRLGEETRNDAVVRTIISLAENLDLQLIAEGVETQEQMGSLIRLGCQYAQGFYLVRPKDAETIGRILQTGILPQVIEPVGAVAL